MNTGRRIDYEVTNARGVIVTTCGSADQATAFIDDRTHALGPLTAEKVTRYERREIIHTSRQESAA